MKAVNARLITIIVLLLTGCKPDHKTVRPSVKRLIEAVYASGNVVSRDEYQLNAQAEGYVLEKVVTDGAVVKAGDPLYILESGQQNSRFQLAQKNYAIAQANYGDDSPALKEAVTAIQAARTRLQFDSVNFERYKNLAAQNATTKMELERSRVQYENSRNEYLLQQSRYRKVRNQLFLELENARSQLAISGNESGKYVIRSETPGKVFRTLKERGELVRRGETIAVIGNDKTFYLSLAADELDISRIKPGQEVVAVIDAFGEKTFRGVVDRIYPFVNRQQQSVRVDVTLTDSLPGYYSGLAAEANIIIRKKERALVVPRSALAEGTLLTVLREGKEEKVKVETGVQTLDEVEVVSGIDENTEIVVSN